MRDKLTWRDKLIKFFTKLRYQQMNFFKLKGLNNKILMTETKERILEIL